MRELVQRLVLGHCALLAISVTVAGQTPAPEGTASISGRVTLNGQPYANAQVLVTAQPKDSDNILQSLTEAKVPHKGSTDSDGHYSLSNLTAGSYQVSVFAPALVGSGHDAPVLVADGEAVEGINFDMKAGGVITGTVMLADGRPAINKSIRVDLVEENSSNSEFSAARVRAMLIQRMSSNRDTDDRGVFRIYGVAAGDYLVSVDSGGGRREDLVTYYPGVIDKTKAVPVKVKAGSEATGIDFRLGLSKKGYEVRGRVIDDSGSAVAGVMLMFSAVREEATPDSASSGLSGEAHSNSQGEFKFEGVRPGKYTASVISMFDEANLYSDTATFEITNSDASGVEIKTHKGLSASGIAVIDGNDDPAVAAQLPQVQLMAMAFAGAGSAAGFGMSRATVAPDGTFIINGLRPGKVMIMASPMALESRFSLLRTERAGVAQNAGIDITPDNPVTDIKVVLGYRNCAIYGRASLSAGTVRKGTGLSVSIQRIASESEASSLSTPDSYISAGGLGRTMGIGSGTSAGFTVSPGGDFRADALVPGDYVVIVSGPGTSGADAKSVTQKVTLTSGAQLEVNLILDLTPKK
jgi:uncharacterized GH25 family protein